MKAELCWAGLSTAAALRPSSCLSSLSQIRRLSMGAAGSVSGLVRCQCDSSAPRKPLHGNSTLQRPLSALHSAYHQDSGFHRPLPAHGDQPLGCYHMSCCTNVIELASPSIDTDLHAWLSLGAGVGVAGSAPALQGFQGAGEDALRHVSRLLRCAGQRLVQRPADAASIPQHPGGDLQGRPRRCGNPRHSFDTTRCSRRSGSHHVSSCPRLSRQNVQYILADLDPP